MSPIIVEGNLLEGGGQIIRNSLTLSAILNKPFEIFNIRAGREVPGLRPQHLACVKFVQSLCSATASPCEVGTTSLTFSPSQINGGKYNCDIKTAGSISLLIQSVLPCLSFADVKSCVEITGGTDVPYSPPIDYMEHVVCRVLKLFSMESKIKTLKRYIQVIKPSGLLPKGGGKVILEVTPTKRISPVELVEFGTVANVDFIYWGTKSDKTVVKVVDMTKRRIQRVCPEAEYRVVSDLSQSVGGGSILVVAVTTTGCVLGADYVLKKGEDLLSAAESLSEKILSYVRKGICVDDKMQDQIILWMSLANGESKVVFGEITLHTRSAIAVAEQFSPATFKIIENEDNNLIVCSGVLN